MIHLKVLIWSVNGISCKAREIERFATDLGDMEFSAIYCPPMNRLEERHFTNLLRACRQRYLVDSDWNARHWLWGDRYNSPRGILFIWLSHAKPQIWHPYFQFGANICL